MHASPSPANCPDAGIKPNSLLENLLKGPPRALDWRRLCADELLWPPGGGVTPGGMAGAVEAALARGGIGGSPAGQPLKKALREALLQDPGLGAAVGRQEAGGLGVAQTYMQLRVVLAMRQHGVPLVQ